MASSELGAPTAAAPHGATPRRICVVGSGTRFLSGITIYTHRLANALAERSRVSVVLMRQLAPTWLYPGRSRVGAKLTRVRLSPDVAAFDGVDWFWLPSILRAIAFLVRQRPQIVILQWWTGTVLHTYLVLALAARALGARVIVEFHEVLDVGEAGIAPVRAYVSIVGSRVLALSSGFAMHNASDRALLEANYPLGDRPVQVLPHGPHDHYQEGGDPAIPIREAPEEVCNLLYFGVVREYKGLDDLIEAFDTIPPDRIDGYWLTIVGETWEGYSRPAELVAASPYRHRMTFVNRYVGDDEVAGFFAGADAVVLPYRRSSTSGPLHIAMGYGLPVMITQVGGLEETAEGYPGTIAVAPSDTEALRSGLERVAALRSQRFRHPRSWDDTASAYERLFDAVLASAPGARPS